MVACCEGKWNVAEIWDLVVRHQWVWMLCMVSQGLRRTVNERWRLERLRFARNSLFRILVNVERDVRLEAIRAAD